MHDAAKRLNREASLAHWGLEMGDSESRQGPFITAALFCERVLSEKDDVPTLVRIVDQFTADISDDDPTGMVLVEATMFIAIKSGGYIGPVAFHVERVSPNDSRDINPGDQFDFTHPEQGARITMDVRIAARTSGTHWFEVFANGHLLTRTPIVIVVNRAAKNTDARVEADQAPPPPIPTSGWTERTVG